MKVYLVLNTVPCNGFTYINAFPTREAAEAFASREVNETVEENRAEGDEGFSAEHTPKEKLSAYERTHGLLARWEMSNEVSYEVFAVEVK